MKYTNLDQAATSFPKPEAVYESVLNEMKNGGVNINRGGYTTAYDLEADIIGVRQSISDLFNGYGTANVIFTNNVTQALNMVLYGLLKQGDHVLISSIEHNAVYRPVHRLAETGRITYDVIPASETAEMDLEAAERMIRPETKAMVINYASNICPEVNPIGELGVLAKKHGILLVVDAAQGAGTHDIDMKRDGIDILCFTGHKGLLGPQGTGGFVIRDTLVDAVDPVLCGGTGSRSDSPVMPEFMPDKFEAGTLNLAGIIGLGAGIRYVKEKGIENIRKEECRLLHLFMDGVEEIGKYHILGRRDRKFEVPVISIQSDCMDEGTLGFRLDEEFGIQTRVGLHCTPLAHRTLGSYPRGAVRFSFGVFTTEEQVRYALEALTKLANE